MSDRSRAFLSLAVGCMCLLVAYREWSGLSQAFGFAIGLANLGAGALLLRQVR